MTKIVGVTMVRNECDIVEVFVRHSLGHCDELIATDHLSSDGTLEILEALRDEGLPLRIVREERKSLHQADVMEQVIRLAAREHGADWVVPLDGDEFLVPIGGLPLREVLEKAEGRPVRVPWRTYVPDPEDDEVEPNVLARIQHRRVAEKETYCKILIPRALALRRDVVVSTGSHRLLRKRWGLKDRKIEGPISDDLALAHFPVRSSEQLLRKVVVSLAAHLAAPEPRPNFGYQAAILFGRLQDGSRLTREELRDLAFDYPSREAVSEPAGPMLRDPVALAEGAQRLRYRDLANEDPVSTLAAMTVDLAEEVSALRTRELRRFGGAARSFMARRASPARR